MFGKTYPLSSDAEMLGENIGTKTAGIGAFRKKYSKIISPRKDGHISGRTPSIDYDSSRKEVKSLNQYRGISLNYFDQRHKLSQSGLSEEDKLNYESARLDTLFQFTPCHVKKYGPLAQAGFFCDENKTLRCVNCKNVYSGWNLDDEHCRNAMRCLNPECKGMTSENIPLAPRQTFIGELRQEQEQQQQQGHSSLRDRKAQHKAPEAKKDKENSSPYKEQEESVVIATPHALPHKCDELTERIETLKKGNQTLQEEISRLCETDSIKLMLLQQMKELGKLQAQIEKYRNRLEEEIKRNQDLAEKCCRLESDIHMYFQHFQTLSKENGSLKIQIKSLEFDHTIAVKEHQDTSKKMRKLSEDLNGMTKELEDTKRNKERLERDFTDHRFKKRQKQKDLNLKLKEAKNRYEDIEKQLLCKVCLDNNINIAFFPCGHGCCGQCKSGLEEAAINSCPVCRGVIDRSCKIYLL